MNLFYVQIDNDNKIINMTTNDMSNSPGWYLAAIDNKQVNDFKTNYKHYYYNPELDNVTYPSDDNSNDLIHPDIPGRLTSLELDISDIKKDMEKSSIYGGLTWKDANQDGLTWAMIKN